MTKQTIVIAYLSVSLAACQYLWLKAEKRASFLEGRQSVFNEFASDGTEGTCYVPTGCNEPTKKGANQ